MINDKDLNPSKIQEIANRFKESRVLLTAIELGVFTILDKKRLTSNEIAFQINTNERATDRLLNVLAGMGFLHKKNGKFMNCTEASDYLVKGKDDYLGNLEHTISLWDRWSTLTEVVKTGKAVCKKEINDRDNEWLEDFIRAMHYRGVGQAKLYPLLLNLSGVNKMLDLGGGSGAYSMAFVEHNPNMESVIFDLPNVIPLSKRYVLENGMSSKFSFIEGDYLKDDFGKGYDLIFLSAIIHINSYEENNMLIKRCADTLNINGQLVISDFIMDEDRVNPEVGALFAINMLVGTNNGDTYTKAEITEWIINAGLNSIELKNTNFGATLMIARKGN